MSLLLSSPSFLPWPPSSNTVVGVKNPRSLPRQSLLSQFLGLQRDCEVCSLRAANGLGVNLHGGLHHLINCLLVPISWQGLVMEVEETFMNETDRTPSFRELSVH